MDYFIPAIPNSFKMKASNPTQFLEFQRLANSRQSGRQEHYSKALHNTYSPALG